MAENGALWRFFEGQKRHFAVLLAGRARLQHVGLPPLMFTEPGCLARRLGRQIGSEAPFFAVRGTKLHVRQGRFDDCADSVGRWGGLRAQAVQSLAGFGAALFARTKPAVNAQGRVRESRCIRYRPISRIDDAIATTRGIVMTVASFR